MCNLDIISQQWIRKSFEILFIFNIFFSNFIHILGSSDVYLEEEDDDTGKNLHKVETIKYLFLLGMSNRIEVIISLIRFLGKAVLFTTYTSENVDIARFTLQ